jgi:type I restriction enzyme S subunit
MEGTSGRQRVNTDHLSNYSIKVPILDTIEKFNTVAAYVEPKLHSNSMQIQTLQKLRDTLLPKLISGEVRVKYG